MSARPPQPGSGGRAEMMEAEKESTDLAANAAGRATDRPPFHQNSVADNVTDIETPSQGRAEGM